MQMRTARPVFTKLPRLRIKIRLKIQNEICLVYFPLSVQENLHFVYIDMVNCLRPKMNKIKV